MTIIILPAPPLGLTAIVVVVSLAVVKESDSELIRSRYYRSTVTRPDKLGHNESAIVGQRSITVRLPGRRTAQLLNRALKQRLPTKAILLLSNGLNDNGAALVRKLNLKLNVASPVDDPAFALIGRCLRKHIPLCRISLCQLSTTRMSDLCLSAC